jgi:2,5-dihydroxypyridine 5,6-dioxygenase
MDAMSLELGTDIFQTWHDELELCKVKSGETVLVFTDAQYPHAGYPGAAVAAARDLDAEAYILQAPSGPMSILESRYIVEAWKAADMVIPLTTIPWLYTDAHNEALESGTRTLMVNQDIASLRRLFPNEAVIKRTFAGAKRMGAGNVIRITDDAGSDFTFHKEGRKGHAQVGVADRPGRWDHWPSGLVACGPLEQSAEGVYCISPGDILLGLRRFVTTPIRLTLHEGLITNIDGGYDATLLRDRIESFNDPDAFRWSHAGWGTEHRADWNQLGMDSESKYGTVMVSIGRNIFNGTDENSGLGGLNRTQCHIDICCRNKNFFLDGEQIVNKDGTILAPELA